MIFFQPSKHCGQDAFVVLHISIEHGEIRGGRGQYALNTGTGQTPPTNSPNNANMRFSICDLADEVGRTIRRIIIHKDCFPTDAVKDSFEPLEQWLDVFAFVEGRY